MWRNEIPKPIVRLTIAVREAHDRKLRKIVADVRNKTGRNITMANVVDYLLGGADAKEVAAKLAEVAK